MNLAIKPIKIKQPKISIPKIKSPKIKGFEFSISKEGRVRIPAKRKKQVYEKYKHTCAYHRCKEKRILDIHHKNMKAHDNRLANLELLCPTHHRKRHEEKYRKVVGRDMFTGKVRKKLVKKKPNNI